jgi:hypothetical protein
MQVHQRQHLDDLGRRPTPRRHDRGLELHPLPADRIDTTIVHARRFDLDRSSGRLDLPRLGVPVAHHPPAAIHTDLVSERVDIRRSLSLKRRRQHPAGSLNHDLIQHRPRQRAG